jgi:hypothetical protein
MRLLRQDNNQIEERKEEMRKALFPFGLDLMASADTKN